MRLVHTYKNILVNIKSLFMQRGNPRLAPIFQGNKFIRNLKKKSEISNILFFKSMQTIA